MTVPEHDAIVTVHAGLADILTQLGEEPETTYIPRHAKPQEQP